MKSQITFLILSGIIALLFISCSKDSTSPDDNEIVTPPTASTVKDVEGNTYKTVVIGTQTWMAENLKTTKFSDGTAIKYVTDQTWSTYNATFQAYCWYNNDINNKNTYGALYNWYAVDTKKLCPTGWHVPSDSEWTILTTFLGGENLAGGKMKEAGTTHWTAPNTDATNSSGFNGLPAGYRDGGNAVFHFLGTNGYWWTSTERSTDFWLRKVAYNNGLVHRGADLVTDGASVRCVKN